MDLLIDVGNTWVKMALHDGKDLMKPFKFLTDEDDQIIQTLENTTFDRGIFTSTATISNKLAQYFEDRNVDELDHTFLLPFELRYNTPETLGRDRIAAVAGAFEMYPKQNCLIIDAGTCITYDFLTEKGVFEGGNIAPGLQLRAKSMHVFTDKLPLINVLDWNHEKIGRSTVEALQNGTVFGTILEIEGYIAQFLTEFPNLNTILTGGDAQFLHDKINSRIFVHPEIVFLGLYKILKYNVK